MWYAVRKRVFPFFLMTGILLGGFGWASAAGDPESAMPGNQQAPREAVPEAPAPTAAASLERERHTAYLSGSDDALPLLRPFEPLTRAQAAQMFFLLLESQPQQPAAYADVPEQAWYAPAAGAMGALGVMRGGEAAFLPDETLSRAEFIRCLACFFPPRTDGVLFPDVPETHPAAAEIRSAQAYGWIQGDAEGCFRPEDPVTRVEAVVMLNRALGRTPDPSYIDTTHPAFYLDAARDSWYYYEIMEATATHTYTKTGETERWNSHMPSDTEPETGFALSGASLYYYDRSRGDLLRNETLGAFRFQPQGQLETGSAWLNRKAWELVQSHPGITPEGLSALLAEASQNEWQLILINRDNPLPEGFAVPEFATLENGYRIDSRVAPALEQFLAGARATGFRPLVCSAYRTWDKQSELFERRVRTAASGGRSRAEAEEAASFWVARPGTSEHQAGLAVDIIDSSYQVLNKSQEKRPVQQWLMAHCAEYGFILRYPTDKSSLTGVGYEPWHYRYVGIEAAQEIQSRGICLEEYLNSPT